MLLEALLTAALETGLGLLAEVGFADEIRDLKARLTKSDERQRREAFERAFAKARPAAGDDAVLPAARGCESLRIGVAFDANAGGGSGRAVHH